MFCVRVLRCRNTVNQKSHDAPDKMADAEKETMMETLTRFTPYEDPPQGAFSKISSFFSRWTKPSRSVPVAATPETEHAALAIPPEHTAGVHYTAVPSGQMSVQSVPPKKQSAGGVSPRKLRKALIQSIKSEEEEMDKGADMKRYWMPDAAVIECTLCMVRFSVTVRKHHCRLCGQIFCSSCCSANIPGEVVNKSGFVRACEPCAQLVGTQYSATKSDESMVTKALTEDNEVGELIVPIYSDVASPVRSPTLTTPSQIVPVGSKTSFSSSASSPTNTLPWDIAMAQGQRGSGDVVHLDTLLLSNAQLLSSSFDAREEKALGSDQLGGIFLAMMDPESGLSPQNHRRWLRTYNDSYQASDIVTWLVNKELAETRTRAVKIGRALVDTKMLQVVSSEDQEFRDDSNIILIPGQQEGEEEGLSMEDSWHLMWRHSKVKREEWCSAGKNEKQSRVDSVAALSTDVGEPPTPARNTPNQQPAYTPTLGKDPAPPSTPPHFHPTNRLTSTPSWSSGESYLEPVRSDYSVIGAGGLDDATPAHTRAGPDKMEEWEAVNRQVLLELESASTAHWEAFLRQLLQREGLNPVWFDVIKPLALEASHTIQPYTFKNAQMDILNYVKVKKVPGGSIVDSALHYGEVFTKSLPFVRMSQVIRSPRVMLLKCALEVHRSQRRLTSMEVLLMQETEYMKHLVARIQSYSPSVIVIEKSAAGLGLDMLLELGITVVTNVKEAVMLRLAHCTEAQPIGSLKGLSLGAECGTCKQFYIRKFSLPDGGKKTLMFFDECKHNRACTIVLRGGSQLELQKVKKVLRFAVFAAYSNLLENRFLWNEFAQPLAPPSYKEVVEEAQQRPDGQGAHASLYPCLPTLAVEMSDNVTPEDKGTQVSGGVGGALEKSLFAKVSDASELNREGLIYTDDTTHSLSPTLTEHTLSTRQDVFLKALSSSLLTFSPHISFSVPFLLQDGIKLRHMTMYLPETICWSEKFAPENEAVSEIKGLVAKQQPAPEPGKWKMESPEVRWRNANKSQHFSPLHVSKQQPLIEDTPLHNYKESTPQRSPASYTSVTSHPFTRTLFFSSAKSNEVKSVLADFRARAGLKGEDQELFFPSARLANQPAPLCSSSPQAGSRGNPMKPRRKPIGQSLPLGRDYALDDLQTIRGAPKRHPTDWNNPLFTVSSEVSVSQPPMQPTTGADGSGEDLLWEPSIENATKLDCMDPYNHQSISLHYGTICRTSPNYPNSCTVARNLTLFYYSQNDITLGDFLARFCFNKATCSSCRLSFQAHELHIAHVSKLLSITMETVDVSVTKGAEMVYTGHTCKECHQSSPNNLLSPESLALSFGKFLELKFYAKDYRRRWTMPPGADPLQKPQCQHSLHHDHVQYFCYKNVKVYFDVQPVPVYEVYIPPIVMKTHRGHATEGMDWEGEISLLAKKTHDTFDAIKERLREQDVEPVRDDVKMLLPRCEVDLSILLQMIPSLLHAAVASGVCKASPGEKEGDCQSLARLQDEFLEVKKALVQASAAWNKHCEALFARISEFVPAKTVPTAPKRTASSKMLSSMGTDGPSDIDESQVTMTEISRGGTPIHEEVEGTDSAMSTNDSGRTSRPQSPNKWGRPPSSTEPQTAIVPSQKAVPELTSTADVKYHMTPQPGSSPSSTVVLPRQPTADQDDPTLTAESQPHSEVDGFNWHLPLHKAVSRDMLSFDEGHFGASSSSTKSGKKDRERMPPFFGRAHKYQPLPNPFPPGEHYVLDTELSIPVGVYESEPSSIIACALSTSKYAKELASIQRRRGFNETHPSPMQSGRATPTKSGEMTGNGENLDSHEAGTKAKHDPHIQVEFADSHATFTCKVYFADEFHCLRDFVYPPGEEKFVRSLLRCIHWRARGGKSGSAFCKVVDDRFVLKQIKKSEITSFLDVANDYLNYIRSALDQKRPTCLAKMLGVYSVRFSNSKTGQSMEGTFIVMENLHYSHHCSPVFDLKGSKRNRLVKSDDSVMDNVYLDENYLQYVHTHPLYVHAHSKAILMQALSADTEFLVDHNVMDYSLLVGVCSDSQQIVVGVIDYLRAFTWDKRLEMWIKRDILVTPGSRGLLPTIISPDYYRNRFLEAMDQYFAVIPDKWYALTDETWPG